MQVLARLIVLAVLLFGLSACEESVNAVLGTEHAFTIYGHFNPQSDTQAVRVYSIDGTIDRVWPQPLDTYVRSIDLETGDMHVWRDSVIQFTADNYGHIFWAGFRPDYEERHRLILRRSDGVETHVDVTIPSLSKPELIEPLVESGYVLLPVLWKRAPRLNNIRVRYHTNMGSYDFVYPNEQVSREDGQVAIVQMHKDVRFVFRDIFQQGGSTRDTRLRAIEQIVLVSSADWVPPGEVYNAELLVEPGTFSNVENGFGYVGAGYEASFYYEVPDSIARAAGFFVN